MRTLQEKYNGVNEGAFSKDQFLRDARLQLPNLVTRFNGYDDAVQILKNRGMLSEGIHDRNILSRPLSNPDFEPLERSPEELGREADRGSESILKARYYNQIKDPNISDEELRFLLSGKGVKGFGGRPNAVDNIINNRRKIQEVEKVAPTKERVNVLATTDEEFADYLDSLGAEDFKQILKGLGSDILAKLKSTVGKGFVKAGYLEPGDLKEAKKEESFEFEIVWDRDKLKRTTYQNGKHYQSKTFGTEKELLADKEKADAIQKKREEKGRDKIKHSLTEARLTEAKGYSFTISFDFSQEEADIKYIQKLLNKAGVKATVKIGNYDELVVFTAADKTELEKAKKIINSDIADEFEYVKNISEARLTKSNLTDYRYKATNDMDKYPYEQILRGLRVELEGLNVLGTPTPEQYTKALAKVLKNLEKDGIFYTNQIAGIKANRKRTDLMIDATPKTVVDKENGMQKAALKEAIKGVIKNILKESPKSLMDPDLYDADEEREERRKSYNDQGDFGDESDFGDYYPEGDEEVEEDVYEMYADEDENEGVGLSPEIFESVSLFDILDEGSSKHSTEWHKGYRAFNDDKKLSSNPYKESPKKEDWAAGWDKAQSDESDSYKGY